MTSMIAVAIPIANAATISITGDVDATVTRTDTLDTVTFNIEILSDNPAGLTYGVGIAFARSVDQPAFQVWYAEAGNIPAGYTEYGWYHQEYGTGWNGEVTPLADIPGFSATGEGNLQPDEGEKSFSVTVPKAELGDPGETYYYAIQVRTNLINSYPEGWGWGSPVSAYDSVVLPIPTPQTKREALRAKGVTDEEIDEAPGLDKPIPNENFAKGRGPHHGPHGPNEHANENARKDRPG